MFERLPAVQVGDDSQAFFGHQYLLIAKQKCPLSRLLTCVNLFGLFCCPRLVYICLQQSSVRLGVSPMGSETKHKIPRPVWCAQISSTRLFQRPVFADLNYVKVGICIKINERNHNLFHLQQGLRVQICSV